LFSYSTSWKSNFQLSEKKIDMREIYFLAILFFSMWLSACAPFRAASTIEKGRQALIAGNNQAALGSPAVNPKAKTGKMKR
jgi:hypothetical protein